MRWKKKRGEYKEEGEKKEERGKLKDIERRKRKGRVDGVGGQALTLVKKNRTPVKSVMSSPASLR